MSKEQVVVIQQNKPEDVLLGIRNYGPKFCYKTAAGVPSAIEPGGVGIVDVNTFKRVIQPSFAWDQGHLMRDDSVLSDEDIKAEDFDRPVNHFTDDEINKLVKNEGKATKTVDSLTSPLTLQRIHEAASKIRPRRNRNIMDACDQRVFLMKNKLPNDFFEKSGDFYRALISERGLPIETSGAETTDELMDKIVVYYSEE